MSVVLRTRDLSFHQLIERRYQSFVATSTDSDFELEIELCDPSDFSPLGDDLIVKKVGDDWLMQRGDFSARWNSAKRYVHIRQTYGPHPVDCVLRIVHTLILAEQGGFLVHAASVIRGGKAFLFAGVSGAGKTTISQLAPSDAILLTDEVSYVRREGSDYVAYGTPFAGELARVGENYFAPIDTMFLLGKGMQNRVEMVSMGEAIQRLLRNILFFADDPRLVKLVFESACNFASLVPIRRLVFIPDQRVWEKIG